MPISRIFRDLARMDVRAQRAEIACRNTSEMHCMLLTELGRSGQLPMKDVVARLELDKGWVSRAVEQLVQEGLVRRVSGPLDRRTVVISLTATGRRRFQALETMLDAQLAVAAWIGVLSCPLLVAEREGCVLGWARAFEYRSRAAYSGVREFSVYVAQVARGAGIGLALLQALIVECERLGHWKLLSRIFPENHASLALCRHLGFREVGVYQRHARLDGEWRDVVIVERLLGRAAAS
ncbi:MAG: GNAT family N-acetyltransferase [Longimicrobiales bacterium]